MAQLNPGQRRALQYWGVIESATMAGASTQDLWQRINEHAQHLGYDSAGVSASDIASLRSRAISVRNSARALDRMAPADMLTNDQIATAPWARELASRNTVPMWQVRMEHNVIRDGQHQTDVRTVVFTGTLPRSRAELETALTRDAAQLARKYGVTDEGIGNYTIMEV